MKKETMSDRIARLCPNHEPRYVCIYDNGGETSDRYTSLFTGRYADGSNRWDSGWFYRGMSEDPYSPQGFGCSADTPRRFDVNRMGLPPAYGRKCSVGRRVHFRDLPPRVRQSIIEDYSGLWNLDLTATRQWCER